nr:hypothetical protein [uncultured Acetobacterium sp.]
MSVIFINGLIFLFYVYLMFEIFLSGMEKAKLNANEKMLLILEKCENNKILKVLSLKMNKFPSNKLGADKYVFLLLSFLILLIEFKIGSSNIFLSLLITISSFIILLYFFYGLISHGASIISNVLFFTLLYFVFALGILTICFNSENNPIIICYSLIITMIYIIFITILSISVLNRNRIALFLRIGLFALIVVMNLMMIGSVFGFIYGVNNDIFIFKTIKVDFSVIEFMEIAFSGLQPFFGNLVELKKEYSGYLVLIPYIEQLLGFIYGTLVLGYFISTTTVLSIKEKSTVDLDI